MIKSTTCLCNYPQANCIIIAFICLWARLCFFVLHANHMCYYFLQLHVDAVIFIEIITPCLINSTIILCLWLHGSSPFVVVVVCCVWFVRACVFVFDYPVLLPQSLKSGEDQTDNMKCSGMEETGNHQVLLLQINCDSWCWDGGWAG